ALTYIWAKIDGPGKFVVNTNIVNSSTNLATFSRAGNYRLRVVISDGSSVATGEVTAVATSVYSTITVSPTVLTVRSGTTNQFSAVQKDQFGSFLSDRPFVWSVVGGGTVTSNGLYIAPSENSTNQVVATVGANSASSTIIVLTNFAPTISSVQVLDHGDHLQCSVTASDDMGTNNLTYTWEPVGAQPSTLTFSTNSSSVNAVDAYFTRFGTYLLCGVPQTPSTSGRHFPVPH
ncbi:MAG: hypothetical protein JZU63_09940, partial [Rhodoferax sp.]|nr:hypothetical protein [Rhodoferax sp.]